MFRPGQEPLIMVRSAEGGYSLNRAKMDHKRLKIAYLKSFFAEHTLLEEKSLNELNLGLSPTIKFSLQRANNGQYNTDNIHGRRIIYRPPPNVLSQSPPLPNRGYVYVYTFIYVYNSWAA